MTYIPGLWVPVCAEGRRQGAQPGHGWVHPILAMSGPAAFFSNAISIAVTWRPPVAFIANYLAIVVLFSDDHTVL